MKQMVIFVLVAAALLLATVPGVWAQEPNPQTPLPLPEAFPDIQAPDEVFFLGLYNGKWWVGWSNPLPGYENYRAWGVIYYYTSQKEVIVNYTYYGFQNDTAWWVAEGVPCDYYRWTDVYLGGYTASGTPLVMRGYCLPLIRR